ncbi:leucine-rich protein [Rhizobium sp. Pop5]|nr:leucine-rich protein [Rhizobium sp. Pop5]
MTGAVSGLVAAYYTLRVQLGLAEPWPALICGTFILLFILLYVLPEWRSEIKMDRLEREGINGILKEPSYFRLTPYQADDATAFNRPDNAAASVLKWIESTSHPILYFWGQSGSGKSSLLNAAVVPTLLKGGWVVCSCRPHSDSLQAISTALRQQTAIWRKPPDYRYDTERILDEAVSRVRQSGKGLILIIDQFEEVFVLGDDKARSALTRVLGDLQQNPRPGLLLLLALRAEYLTDVMTLGLPGPALGSNENAYEVRPFTRAAGQDFIEHSGLLLGEDLVEEILGEAAEIEDMPDRVRPIVLNLLGLVVSSFHGALPKGVKAGRLLSGYVERSLKNPLIKDVSLRVLRPLVTDVGTKRTLSTAELSEQAKLDPSVVRGCLIAIANDGLVRILSGNEERWEVAHDFIARLMQPMFRDRRDAAWYSVRTWLPLAALTIWLLTFIVLSLVYPRLHDDYILRELASVGLVPGPPAKTGNTLVQNGLAIQDEKAFWNVASQANYLSTPVVSLTIDAKLTGRGVPDFPKLKKLDLNLSTLEDFPNLPNLLWLRLSGDRLESLKGLPSLPALRKFELIDTRVTNFVGMPSMPALQEMTIDFNDIRGGGLSFEGMPLLPQLQKLQAPQALIESFKGLISQPELVRLELGSILIGGPGLDEGEDDHALDFGEFPPFPKLEALNLYLRKPLNLARLSKLSALKSIELQGDKIVGLEGLASAPSLNELKLSVKGSFLVKDVPALPSLTSLRVDADKLIFFDMADFPVLEKAQFDGILADLPNISAGSPLTELRLVSGREITSLDDFPDLKHLSNLDLRYLKLGKLSKLPPLENLMTIYLPGNKLADYSGLEGHRKLNHIYVYEDIDPKIVPSDVYEAIPQTLRQFVSAATWQD